MAGTTNFDYRWAIGIRKDWPEIHGPRKLACYDPEGIPIHQRVKATA
ncbi:MAG TPA: hypothetical protein VJ386_07375 [Candidatus Deferrimicrobiaceae bacterium]|nr:hypothetical protein [Candidatus Deferrimicrobiaceae bacterium]